MKIKFLGIFSTKYIKFTLLLIICLTYSLFVSQIIPFDMDEVIEYHQLGCWLNKYSHLNTFREPCNGWLDLAPFGLQWPGYLPLRSYAYVGSISGLFYLPILYLWNSPYSERFFNVLFLLIQSAALVPLLRINISYIFMLLLAYFPYAIGHTVDFGPINFQNTSIFIIYLLLKRIEIIYASKEHKFECYLWSISIGIIIFIGIWIKLSYFFVVPGIIICLLYEFFELFRNGHKKILRYLLLILISASIPSLLLLFSSDIYEIPYYKIVTSSPKFNIMGLLRNSTFYKYCKLELSLI